MSKIGILNLQGCKGEYSNDKRNNIGTIYQTGEIIAEYKYSNNIPVYCNRLIKRDIHTYSIYTGEIDRDGLPSGQGTKTTYRVNNDSVIETYAGKFENGHRHGIGYTNMNVRVIYVVQWQNYIILIENMVIYFKV